MFLKPNYMPENKSINFKFTNYLLLNASFSDSIGLILGKSASLLFFGISKNIFEKDHISVSFLEEILTQINQFTPLTFGHGIAGVGAVIQWMKSRGILVQGPEELLEEAEILLLKLAYSGKLEAIDIADGLCGLGLYFLQRVECYKYIPEDKGERFRYYRYRECIIALLLQLKERCNDGWMEYKRPFSYWHGYPGIYLFLHRVNQLQFLEPATGNLLSSLEKRIISEIESRPFEWEKIEAYFVIAHISPTERGKTNLIKDLIHVDPETCSFEYGALRAFQLHVLAEKFHLPAAKRHSQKLYQMTINKLLCTNLPDLFPFDPKTNSVPLGMKTGLAGTALPLISLMTGNTEWLEVLGIKQL